MKHTPQSIGHVSPSRLALYARGDLSFWFRSGVERHLNRCEECSRVTGDFVKLQGALAEASNELPPELSGAAWQSLSREMTANIRLGIAAGECVNVRPALKLNPRMAFALAGVVLLGFIVGLERPKIPAAAPQPFAQTRMLPGRMLEDPTPSGRDVIRTVNTRGDVGTRYVDDTGVTINVVYASSE